MAQPVAKAEPVDYFAGRNFTLGRARIERGVLMSTVDIAASNHMDVPPLERLARAARVRFVSEDGTELPVARAIVTWKD